MNQIFVYFGSVVGDAIGFSVGGGPVGFAFVEIGGGGSAEIGMS
jgi:hypothetical protein